MKRTLVVLLFLACGDSTAPEPTPEGSYLLRGRAAVVVGDSFQSCEIGGRVVFGPYPTGIVDVTHTSGLLSDSTHATHTSPLDTEWRLRGSEITRITTSAPEIRLTARSPLTVEGARGDLQCGILEASGGSWPVFGWWELTPYPLAHQ